MATQPLLIMADVHRVLRGTDERVFSSLSEELGAEIERAGWFERSPFRSISVLFYFDPSCPRFEIITIDARRNDELFLRCSPTPDEVSAAKRARQFGALIRERTLEVLTAVAERYGLRA
ncbi:MAG: hypothetical protein ACTHU0_30895 [Kofleriaceae bacterium]